MGSYACTCAISELPIEAGDPILIVPLAAGLGQSFGAESKCRLAFPPAKAIYDDCGFAEAIQASAFHDAFAAKLGHADAKAFFEALRAGLARAEGRDGPAALQFALARQDAWEAMLSLPVEWPSHGARAGLASAIAAEGAREGARLLAEIPAILSTPEWLPMRAKADGPDYSIDRLAAALFNGPLDGRFDEDGAFGSMYADRLGVSRGSQGFFLGPHCRGILAIELPAKASLPELEAALRLCGEAAAVGAAMNSLRKAWQPVGASGHQGGEWPLHSLWARKLSEIADASVDWDADSASCGFPQAKSLRERDHIASASPPAPKGAKGRRRSI